MGLVGLGRAFNLRFMPNGPLRTNCYHRQMPSMGIFGGGNFSYRENINIQQGPTGFWGFMTGLTYAFGMFGNGIFGLFGGKKANSETGIDPSEDAHLKALIQALGSKGTFSKHPDKPDYYIMSTKDGIIEGTFQDLLDKFKGDAQKEPDNSGSTDTKGPEIFKKAANPDAQKEVEKNEKQQNQVQQRHEPVANVKQPKVQSKEVAVSTSVNNTKRAEKNSESTSVNNTKRAEKNSESTSADNTTKSDKSKDKTSPKGADPNVIGRIYGKRVAGLLVGYTTKEDQKKVTSSIKYEVNSKNVVSFLKGYEDNKGVLGSQFFTQLISEYGYDEKYELIEHTANQLIKYCNDNGKRDLAQNIKKALADKNYQKLDILKAELLTDNKE